MITASSMNEQAQARTVAGADFRTFAAAQAIALVGAIGEVQPLRARYPGFHFTTDLDGVHVTVTATSRGRRGIAPVTVVLPYAHAVLSGAVTDAVTRALDDSLGLRSGLPRDLRSWEPD